MEEKPAFEKWRCVLEDCGDVVLDIGPDHRSVVFEYKNQRLVEQIVTDHNAAPALAAENERLKARVKELVEACSGLLAWLDAIKATPDGRRTLLSTMPDGVFLQQARAALSHAEKE